MSKPVFLPGVLLLAMLSACGGSDSKSNGSPTTANASLAVNEDQPGTVSVVATDPDNDPLSISIVTPPTQGSATVSGTGPFTIAYTPGTDRNGTDSLVFSVTDPDGATATGRVDITIAPQPDAPAVNAQNFAGVEDTVLRGQLTATDADGDTSTYIVVDYPQGSLDLDSATGSFSYLPSSDFTGTDSFTVRASDGALQSAPATVNLVLAPVNDPPVAVKDGVTVAATGTSTLNVLANDLEVDGDALQIEIVGPTPGATAVVSGGAIQFTPVAGAAGPTSFTYRVSDPSGASSVATVRVVIGAATPFFFSHYAGWPSAVVTRYDFHSRQFAALPEPLRGDLSGFSTSANGRTVVYFTYNINMIARFRTYVVDVNVPTAVPRELTTSGFPTGTNSITSDGGLSAFGYSLTKLDAPMQTYRIEADSIAERPQFARDDRHLYYSVVSASGGHVIKRSDVTPDGILSNPVQITADYPLAEGLGPVFALTPDESRIVSQSHILPLGSADNRSLVYVTSTDGTQNDALLHPAFSSSSDNAEMPRITPDSRYAAYVATLGGVTGLYSTELSAPGTALRIDTAASLIAEFLPAGDSHSIFYRDTDAATAGGWYRALVDQPASAMPFAPLGSSLPEPRVISAAPDGSAVVFDSGSEIYATLGNQYSTATLLYQRTAASKPIILYAPDSSSVAIADSATGELILLNPRIPGWSENLGPVSFGESLLSPGPICIAYGGSGC